MAVNSFIVSYNLLKICMVASPSYEEFIQKCRKKFNLQNVAQLHLCFEDDTEIDEEFYPCISNGEKLKLKSKSVSDSLVSSLHQFLVRCLEQEPDLSKHLQELLMEGSMKQFNYFVSNIVGEDGKVSQSLKEEHPGWFEGLSSKLTSKESWLRSSAECRVRGYFSQLQRELKTMLEENNLQTNCEYDTTNYSDLQLNIEEAIQYFKHRLKSNKYHQSYFDRAWPCQLHRLCSPDGVFPCGGEYNSPACASNHSINPYATRELRIVFSTWNLDHMIEKSRQVIPKLKQLLRTRQLKDINLDYFYDLLFTIHSQHRLRRGDQLDSSCHFNNVDEPQNVVVTGFLETKLVEPNTIQSKRKLSECYLNDCDEADGNHFNNKKNKITHPCTRTDISCRKSQSLCNSNEKFSASLPKDALECATRIPSWDGNLKLVHIACHIKLPHSLVCDEKNIIIKLPRKVSNNNNEHTSTLLPDCCVLRSS